MAKMKTFAGRLHPSVSTGLKIGGKARRSAVIPPTKGWLKK